MSVVVANSLDEVLDALSARPDATLLAGGTDVMVEINLGHRRPTSIVSIDRVPELRTWTFHAADQTVQLGAAVRYGEIGAGPGRTHGRVAADPGRRHHRREPGNVLAGG